jgi:hypothetical protein
MLFSLAEASPLAEARPSGKNETGQLPKPGSGCISEYGAALMDADGDPLLSASRQITQSRSR